MCREAFSLPEITKKKRKRNRKKKWKKEGTSAGSTHGAVVCASAARLLRRRRRGPVCELLLSSDSPNSQSSGIRGVLSVFQGIRAVLSVFQGIRGVLSVFQGITVGALSSHSSYSGGCFQSRLFFRPVLGESEVEVVVVVGVESVTLPGKIELKETANYLKWTRGNKIVHIRDTEGDDPRKQNLLFTNRTQMKPDALQSGDMSLILKNPTLTDSGTYICVVRKGLDIMEHIAVALRVKGETVTVTEDSSVSLPFPSRVFPPEVQVKWTRLLNKSKSEEVHLLKNSKLDFSAQSSEFKDRTEMKSDALQRGDLGLNLKNLKPSDSGEYTCVVTDGSTNTELARTEVKLDVNKEDRSGTIIAWVTGVLSVLILFVVCVLWLMFKRMKKIKEFEKEVEVGVENVILPGEIECHESVTSVEWTRRNKTVHIRNRDGDDLGDQDLLYRDRTQMKDKNALKSGDMSLILKKPTLTDSGIYVCVVKKNHYLLKLIIVNLKVKEHVKAPRSRTLSETGCQTEDTHLE
ncbi:hypothetical protein WMY93_002444 [Mugilogobius chulae]|uniref:Ig-like domain-containing protein n=1 Tax=Mugilogobius chulae TaxID=88201 RepID=A0AAW0PVG3_9GOBI